MTNNQADQDLLQGQEGDSLAGYSLVEERLVEEGTSDSSLSEDPNMGTENVSSEEEGVTPINLGAVENEEEHSLPELDPEDYRPVIEALILASGEPLAIGKIAEITKLSELEIETTANELISEYQQRDAGFELVNIGGRYQFRTKAKYAPFIVELKLGKPKKLSPSALETLAIVAYRQPIVKSDIEKIRGVDATPTIKTLLDKKLIKIVGHQATVGQPALYGTTEIFLKIFGLSSLSELPTLRDLKEIAEEPGEASDEVVTGEYQEGESLANIDAIPSLETAQGA